MNFGDLIAYSRGLYTHYAMYTGKKDGKDMSIQFTGEPGLNSKAGAKVVEGPLEPGGKVNNQLEKRFGWSKRSDAEIRADIPSALAGGFGPYDVIGNNCEHLATRLRYGKAYSQQAEKAKENQTHFQNEMAANMGCCHH